MEDEIKNQIENIILTSPSVLRRAPTVAVEEHAPLVETPAMPAEQSTYQGNGRPAFRTNVSAAEPEPIDVARYAGAGHLSNTRLANTEYGEKDALYYKTKYAPVVPFKTLYGNAQITTTTKAENKQGWEFDTSVLGMPDLRYVGYNRIEPPTENLIQAGARGVFNLISNFGETVGRFARNVTQATGTIEAPETVKAVMPYLTPRRPGADIIDNISAIYTAARDKGLINYDPQTKKITDGDGKPKEGGEPIDVFGALNSDFAAKMDDFARWSKDNLYWVYTDENETDMSDNARITYGLGSGLGTVALSVAAPWAAGGVAAVEAMGAFNDVFENNVANGVPVKRALGLATGAGALVGALGAAPEIGGRITFNTLYQAERNLLRQARNKAAATSLLNHSRDVTKSVSRTANVVTGIGEMITEPLQTDVTLLAANNLDWSVFNTPRWDERAIEIGAAFLGSVVGGVINTSTTMRNYDDYNKRATDFKERVSAAIDEYRPLLEGAVKDGIMTKEQMNQLISIAALPENYDYALDFVKDSIAGQFDKVPANMINDFQKRMETIDPNAVLSDEMKKLDENVLAAIAKANKKSKYPFTDEDAALIVSLFHGIAHWKLWQDGVLPSQIEIPELDTFKKQPKNGVEYGTTSSVDGQVTKVTIGNNVLPTDMPSSAKSTMYDSLIPQDNPNVDRTISARHSNILHEIGGHLLEKMVGIKGSGAFFEEFYRAISMAFGEKRAIEVQKAEDISNKAKKSKKDYVSPANKSENLAQAVGALAENAARVAGIEGTPADFVTFANLVLNGMNKATVLVEGVRNYMSEIEAAIKENEDIVADLVNVFGTERTNSALKEFMSDDVKELSDTTLPAQFLVGLVEAINGFASEKTIPVLRAMFDGVNPERFVEKTKQMFRDALAAGRLNVENATPANKALYAKAEDKAKNDALLADIIDMLGPDAASLVSDDLNESGKTEDKEFVGVQANLPITQELSRAQQMFVKNVSDDEIFKQTGWFLDKKDNKWKYEIPSGDVDADEVSLGSYVQLPNGKKEYRQTFGWLEDFYKNEKLFQAYPQLKDIPVNFYPGETQAGRTTFNDDGSVKEIAIKYKLDDPAKSIQYVLVHELQHVIQGIEGFAAGGVPEGRTADEAWNNYQKLAGEIEARNVQKRLTTNKLLPGLGNTEKVLPTKTQDIADSDAIVVFDNFEIQKYVPAKGVLEESEAVDGWHGTRHLFDIFKTSGTAHTGEGGNAHGWGVYLTTLKNRAKHYWHDIALESHDIDISLDVMTKDGTNHNIKLKDHDDLYDAFIEFYNEFEDSYGWSKDGDYTWYNGRDLLDEDGFIKYERENAGIATEDLLDKVVFELIGTDDEVNLDDIVSVVPKINGDFGQMLKVLTPDTDTMIQEDKMLIDQSDYVQNKIKEINKELGLGIVDSGIRGKAIYNKIADALDKDGIDSYEAASKYLSEHGINGIEYDGRIDGKSFVVFDPNTLNILEKYRDLDVLEDLEMSPFGLPTLDSFFVPDTPDANMTEAGKLLNSKVKDRTLSQDLDNTLATVKSTKQTKASKIINALYKKPWIGTLADKLNSVGGEKLKKYFDLVGDASKYEIKLRNLQSQFIAHIKKATHTNDLSLIALNSMLSQDVATARVRSIPNSDIGAFERPINGFVVMDLYLNKMQGENIFERTKAGYATGEVDRILNDYLTPEIKAYADGILSFYQSVKPEIEKARGKTIGLEEEFYAPVSNAFYSGLTAQSINSMMARTDRKSALVGEDALALADKYIRRLASSLTGRYQTLKRLNDVLFLVPDKELAKNSTREEREEVERLKLLSSELRGEIRNVLGEDGLQNIRHDVENELAFNDVTPYVKSGVFNKVSNSTVTGLLSWNPLSFFKNAANVTSFWGRTDSINQYLSDTMYALMHPKEAIEYMKSFDVVKNRLQGRGIDDLLNTDVAGGESVLTDIRNALKYNDKYNITGTIAGITTVANRFGLKAFMQNGDAFANIFGAYGYAKYLERQGMSHDEINQQLQKAVDETQASSNQAMKNALQKNWQRQGLLGNFIAFTQEPMAKSKTITDALLAYSRGEITAKEFGKRVAPIIMSVAIFAMISSGFMDLWSSDDRKRKEANKSLINEAIQAMSGITPFGNTFIAPFIEYAIGTMSNPTFSPSLITETRNALNDMSEGDIKGIGARALTFTGMLQGAPRLLNVLDGGAKQFSDNPRTREIGSYQMWGRGERYAEKRVGKNK